MRIGFALGAAVTRGLLYALLDKLFTKVPIVVVCFFSAIMSLTFWSLVMIFGKHSFNVKNYFQDKSTMIMFFSVVILFLVANTLILFAIKDKNATIAGLLEISYPIFTAIASYILFKQSSLNAMTIIGGILIFTGITLVYLFNK